MSYSLPAEYSGSQGADGTIVAGLVHLLRRRATNGERGEGPSFLSVTDLGAGVGAYGRALISIDARFVWRGFDGAANVRAWSRGFVQWADLSTAVPISRADWAMSLETGEHIPHALERVFVRNLHAANRCGVVLSWAGLGQKGIAHVNNHSPEYLADLWGELGYAASAELTEQFRHGEPVAGMPRACKHGFCWFERTVTVWMRKDAPLYCRA